MTGDILQVIDRNVETFKVSEILLTVLQWRIPGVRAGGGHAPTGVSYELVNLSFIISGHRKWPHLAIASIL